MIYVRIRVSTYVYMCTYVYIQMYFCLFCSQKKGNYMLAC